jgi:threonine dehydrogenase-like Zn-dependent dehydrogenase
LPRVIGHEIGGQVVEIPENDKGIRAGDLCAIEPYINCGHCRACRLERPNCCEDLKLLGVHVDGGMQGYLAVPIRLLHKSATLTPDQFALIETLGIGAHAVRRSGLAKGETALVVGAGPIGLSVVQFALAAGAAVRVVEKSEIRRDFVRRLGVEVLDQPDGELADVVFDATGNAQVMAESLRHVGAGGRLVFVGLCRDAIAIDDPLFHKREVTLFASRNSCHQFPRIIGMIERGEIDTAPWINFRMPLRDVPKGFADLRKRPDLIKAIIEVEDNDALS